MLGATASRWCRAGELLSLQARGHRRILLNRTVRTQTANLYPIVYVGCGSDSNGGRERRCLIHSSTRSGFHGNPLSLIGRATTRPCPQPNLFAHVNAFLADSSSSRNPQSQSVSQSDCCLFLFLSFRFFFNMSLFCLLSNALPTTGFDDKWTQIVLYE